MSIAFKNEPVLMKINVLLICFQFFFWGCSYNRISYRYGDGTPYQPMEERLVKQKIRLCSVKFFNEKETRFIPEYDYLRAVEPSVSDVVSYAADVLTDKVQMGGGQAIDVVLRFKETKEDSSALSLFSLIPTVPFVTHFKREVVVEIQDSWTKELLSFSSLTGRYSKKLSFILFFGSIPYGSLPDYQENVLHYEEVLYKRDEKGNLVNSGISPKVINAFNRALAHCIAMQIRKSMMDRLTMPDVDFQ